MQKRTYKIVGFRPLIMHNGRTADPLDHYAKVAKLISGKRTKSDDDHKRLAEVDWEAGLYWCQELGLYMPSDCLEAAIIGGAKRKRKGKDATAAILVDAVIGVPIDLGDLGTEGPHANSPKLPDPAKREAFKAALQESPRFRIRKAVKIQKNRVMRTRPMLPPGWNITFTLEIDETVVNPTDVDEWVADTGQYIGLCDWRPKFGRFWVAEIDGVEQKDPLAA